MAECSDEAGEFSLGEVLHAMHPLMNSKSNDCSSCSWDSIYALGREFLPVFFWITCTPILRENCRRSLVAFGFSNKSSA